VVVGSGPGEAHQIRSGPVAGGEALHLGQHVGFGPAGRHVESAGQAQRLGHHVEQLVE
jgi:hypothetical protein